MDISVEDEEICLICDEQMTVDQKLTVIKQKQINTFIEKSQARKEDDWHKWEGKSEMKVHESCRLMYSKKRAYPPSKLKKLNEGSPSTYKAVSPNASWTSQEPEIEDILEQDEVIQDEGFDFKADCFICGKRADRKKDAVHTVTANCLAYYTRLRSQSENEEDRIILQRLRTHDSKEECLYHEKCRHKFLSSKIKTDQPKIRHDSKKIDEIAETVCQYIETSGRFRFDMDEINEIIGAQTITNSVFFDRLKKRFGEDINILQRPSYKPIIFYKLSSASNVFGRWFLENGNIDELEKKLIITTAAEILKAEIAPPNRNIEKYPAPANFLDNLDADIPLSMNDFFKCMMTKDKIASVKNVHRIEMLCHSLLTLLEPSFSSRLQLALGIYVLRKTGKKQIINLLYKLGVCASYDAVQLFESSTVLDPPVKTVSENAFVQFVFDNTDHNVSTLDGKETFHCLGGIAAYTPEHAVHFEGGSTKLKKIPRAQEISSHYRIDIIPFGGFNSALMKNFIFRSTKNMRMQKPPNLSPCSGAYLWSRALRVPGISSWKGFMEFLSREIEYEKSLIICQPFINLPPSDYTTINTALHFAVEECKKLNLQTCFVTFDQPLYYKARCIVDEDNNEKLRNVQVRLGGFHLLMSYFGSIGVTMDGSGLEELWSEIYAPNSIKQMMSGHAFARALRAHVLTFTAIGVHICRLIETTQEEEEHLFNLFESIYNPAVLSDSSAPLDVNRSLTEEYRATMAECEADVIVKKLTDLFVEKLSALEKEGPTAKLWSQYFRCVTSALQFLEAERLGNFKLHMQSLREILPFFHATGHFAYAKCGQIYLQDCDDLEQKMPDIEFKLYTTSGYFTIRRTDKPWSGTWSDMTIETTLNKFFGTDLKHGRGVTPSVVTRYLAAMPSAFSIMESLEDYCGVVTATSEQHVDLNKSRRVRDLFDINKLLSWLDSRKPFDTCADLKSLGSGIIADKTITCHFAKEKGEQSMEKMVGKTISELSLSRTFNIKPLAAMKNSVHLNDSHLFPVDTNLLFQRLLATVNLDDVKAIEKAFMYELSPFPMTLFDEEGLMRKCTKSDLYKIMKPATHAPHQTQFQYVVDGGFLLRKVVWPHSADYKTIFAAYLNYILKHYRADCVVVFDGYNPLVVGTKSYERYQRKEKISAAVEIIESSTVVMNQQKFFSNTHNKYNFVAQLSTFLKENKIETEIAVEDADVLIVQTAKRLALSADKPVAVVGNDVDLLVLMIALFPPDANAHFHKVVPGSKGSVFYSVKENAHLRSYVLFAHAFSGCDTTSAIFNKGKKKIFTLFEKDKSLKEISSIFFKSFDDYVKDEMKIRHNVSEEQVRLKVIDLLLEEAEEVIYYLFDEPYKGGGNVNQLRYKIFCKSASSSKKQLSLAMLPPTKEALKEHVKRVYLQIQAWLGNFMRPQLWGWKSTKTVLFPIMTTKAPAPEELLRQISCSCRTDCKSQLCTCKKAGLPCTQICKNCNGDSCENASSTIENLNEEFCDEQMNEDIRLEETCEDVDVETDTLFSNENYHPDAENDNVYDFESE